jgi:hypothetical protein
MTAVSIVGGFSIGGLGLGHGNRGAGRYLDHRNAVRNPPRYPIVPAALRDFRRHLLGVIVSIRIGSQPLSAGSGNQRVPAKTSPARGALVSQL